MKINGRKLSNNNLQIVVLPRDDGDLVFKFKPILSTDKFDTICKIPEPPFRTDENGTIADTNSPVYRKQILVYLDRKTSWMFLESISATEGLEWDKVKIEDPETWAFYAEDIKEAGITETEFTYLRRGFEIVNTLNEEHLEEARNRFLASIRPTDLKT